MIEVKVGEKLLRKNIGLFIFLFACSTLILGSILYLFYKSDSDRELFAIKAREQSAVDMERNIIDGFFDSVVSDLLFLSTGNEILSLSGVSGKSWQKDKIKTLQQEYLAFSRTKRIYDQVRLINREGMETARVNFNNGNPKIVPTEQLQDKSGRYYFKDTVLLPRGDVYLSPLDLNIEDGKIEVPLKPMIRLATPVFNHDGEFFGVVVLNCLAQNLLSKIMEAGDASIGEKMMVNDEGYWFFGSGNNWAFMYPDQRDQTFAFEYPRAWSMIQKEGSGQFLTDNGLFTFYKVYPGRRVLASVIEKSAPDSGHEEHGHQHYCQSLSTYYWVLINRVPEDVLDSAIDKDESLFYFLAGGLVLFTGLSSFLFSFYMHRRDEYRAKLERLAHYDNLTGLPNRALFFDRLNVAIRNSERYGGKVGLLYIDLDGFKSVNDTLGHAAGDELLKEVARKLTACVRKSDTIARMGGDEFACILGSVKDMDSARSVGSKMVSELENPVDLSSGTVRVGASIGAVVYPDQAKDAQTLLKLSDQAMYAAKRRGGDFCSLSECGL